MFFFRETYVCLLKELEKINIHSILNIFYEGVHVWPPKDLNNRSVNSNPELIFLSEDTTLRLREELSSLEF